jgi:hypothetical protein
VKQLFALASAAFLIATACGQMTATSSQVASEPRVASSPLPSPTDAPLGTAVAAQVLAPAKVMPAAMLCTTPIEKYQDGNAGPLFCHGGAINVAAWQYFAQIDDHILALGPNPTVDQVKAAIRGDFGNHTTNVIEGSGYELARAYYNWTFDFDYWSWVTGGAP